jgi:MFS family permease
MPSGVSGGALVDAIVDTIMPLFYYFLVISWLYHPDPTRFYVRTKHRISATIAVTLSSFITSLMGSSLNVALPAIQEEFSIHAVTLTWVTTSYILSNAVFLIIVGKIADIVGRKRIFLLGIGVFAVSTGLAGFCGSITPLLTCRVLQGIGSAMVNGTAMAIISRYILPTSEVWPSASAPPRSTSAYRWDRFLGGC